MNWITGLLTVGKLEIGWSFVLHGWVNMHDKVVGSSTALLLTIRHYDNHRLVCLAQTGLIDYVIPGLGP
jgi:hypothetical protein